MFGQKFILAYDGREMTPDLREFFRRFAIGGVILFADNYVNREHLQQSVAGLQRDCTDNARLFVGTDHEGGRVQRFRHDFPRLASAAELGQLAPEDIRRLYRQAAEELRETGVNINFAPVADVTPKDRPGAIGDRAFHWDPAIVAECVTAAVQGIQDAGIMACVKHFPGHGPTEEDSHATLPTIRKAEADLLAQDGRPFASAISSGVEAVMTAHCVFPNSGDPDCPASLSHHWLSTVLRGRFGFNGLIISDAIEMSAITRNHTPTDAAAMAIGAGTDIVIFYLIEEQLRAVHDLCMKHQQGSFDAAETKMSLNRIAAAKRRWVA